MATYCGDVAKTRMLIVRIDPNLIPGIDSAAVERIVDAGGEASAAALWRVPSPG